MKKYNENAFCPKCDNEFVKTKYEEGFLRRICVRCGYEWVEEPLDKEENDK